MKELTRTRRLIIATVLFVLLIIIGLLTLRKPDFEYRISANEMLEELYNKDNEMLPDEAKDILTNADPGYIFVDLRNPYDFNKGSLENAINIPVSDILDNDSQEFFLQMASDSKTVVLIGDNQLEANGPWMLLKQLGFKNLKILLGGYKYLSAEGKEFPDLPEIPAYEAEEASMDFSGFIEGSGNAASKKATPEQSTIQMIQRKKKSSAEGGC